MVIASCLLHTGQAGSPRFLWGCWLSIRASRGTACLDLRSSKGSQGSLASHQPTGSVAWAALCQLLADHGLCQEDMKQLKERHHPDRAGDQPGSEV